MKLPLRLVLLVLVALIPLLTSCQSTKSDVIPGTSGLAPTSPDSVQILLQTPERNFRVLGIVRITRSMASFEKDKDSQRRFQVEAARLGAQAVIIDSYPTTKMSGEVIKGEARAIVWDNRKPE